MRRPAAPKIGFLTRLFGGGRRKQEEHASTLRRIQDQEAEAISDYNVRFAAWENDKALWDADEAKRHCEHENRQAELHAEVDQLRAAWVSGDAQAIIEHASLVLESSVYPEILPKDFDISFDSERGLLVVDYQLPLPSALPLAKTVRFNAGTGELSEVRISKTEARDLYDLVCYQVCLRTIHELFEADTHLHLRSVVFNGIVHSVDPATGRNRCRSSVDIS
jgi:restriction system protein